MRTTKNFRAVALLPALVLATSLTACGSGSDESRTVNEVLTDASKVLSSTSGVALDLVSEGIPDSVSTLIAGNGVLTNAPGFEGKITVQTAGLKPSVPIVAVNGDVYAQLPLTTGWQKINPADYGAPNPADLLSTDRGLGSWLTATTGPKRGESIRGGVGNKEILTEYTGSLPASAAAVLVPSIDSDVAVTYAITDTDELRKVTIAGDITNSGATESYTISLEDYGTSKTITAP